MIGIILSFVAGIIAGLLIAKYVIPFLNDIEDNFEK